MEHRAGLLILSSPALPAVKLNCYNLNLATGTCALLPIRAANMLLTAPLAPGHRSRVDADTGQECTPPLSSPPGPLLVLPLPDG